MDFDRPADYFLLFELLDPDKSLAVGFWNYGEAVSEPFELLTKHSEGVASALAKQGYQMYQSDKPNFTSYVVIKDGVDVDRALSAGQSFLKRLVQEVVTLYDGQ